MLFNGEVTQVGSQGYSDRYELWDELFPTPARSGGAGWPATSLAATLVVATGVARRLMGILM